MSIQIVKFEPSKKARNNGAIALVIALEAPNKKAAEVMATGKLWEAYPAAADNFLKPEIVEDQPGCPRPAVGVFDEQFAIDNELNSELKCWKPRALEAPPAGPVDLMEQPANVRIAAVVMYGEGEIDNSQLSLVVDMLNDEDAPDDTGMREVIDALVSVTQVSAMYPSAVYRLVSAIFEQAGEAVPAKADILAFAQEWVSNPSEREKIKLGSPSVTSTKVERTETGATAGVPNNDDRGYPHTLDTLDYEIGAALLPMDFDIFNIPLAIHRRVKEVVAKKESPWKEWSAMLRKTTGVLEFSRAQIFELIRAAKPDLHQFPTSHREYINANLGRQPAAKTKEPEVSNLGDGKFSVEGLIGEQPITDTNNSKKPENSIADKWQHGRLAWLYGEAIAALDGKTVVMDTHDVTELMGNVNDGSSSHSYVSRMVALGIEPGDSQEQLSADDVHHITCDVLESWSADEAQRNAFINERVKFYLTDANQPEPVSDSAALQAKAALDNLGYGVYAADPEPKSEMRLRAEKTLEDATELVQQLHADDFQQRANQVEQALADQPLEDRDNLGIWNRVYKTDAKFTKAFANNGGGTSINGTYMVMQATKVFGPHGINWGVDVLEERFDNGAPIMQPVKQPDGSFIKGIVSNGAGGYLCEVNHTVKIRLWYKQDGKTGEVLAYGCTPYIYGTKNGAMSDGEAPKKSLTDATKKALSQLGFSADVFLGLYDDVNYREENDAEFALKNASEKAEGVTRLREELDEKLTKVAETISKAVTVNEANKVHASIAREVDAHRKAFEAKGDTEHARYLAGRLRRLTTLKDERIKALSASEEKTQ